MNHDKSSKGALAPLSLCAVMAFWASGTAIGGPQEETATFGEVVNVDLVNVEVWVRDEQGNPVTGLQPEDFRVSHDGHPVTITHFSEIRDGEAVEPAAATEESAAPPATPLPFAPAHLVVYFDELNLQPASYPRLTEGLRALLDSGDVEPERVLVVRQARNLYVEVPFGSSRKVLDEALERLAQPKATGLAVTALNDQAFDTIQRVWQEAETLSDGRASGLSAIPDETAGGGTSPRAALGNAGSAGLGLLGDETCELFMTRIGPFVEGWARERANQVSVTLRNLSDIAGFLAGLPGIKTLLYMGDSLETDPGAPLVSFITNLCPGRPSDLGPRSLSQELSASFESLIAHCNTNQVTIHGLQGKGLEGARENSSAAGGFAGRSRTSRASKAYETTRRVADRQGLVSLAGGTGGTSVFNQNDLSGEMRRIGVGMQRYYSLAYPLPPSNGRREHRIEVEMRDRSLRARYREGYLEKDAEQQLVERLEGALNLGLTSNPLGTRLGAGNIEPREEGSYALPLHVMVPIERIAYTDPGDPPMGRLSVRILARELESAALARQQKIFQVKQPPAGTVGMLDLPVEMTLPEGTYLLAIGLRDDQTGEASFVSTSIEVKP